MKRTPCLSCIVFLAYDVLLNSDLFVNIIGTTCGNFIVVVQPDGRDQEVTTILKKHGSSSYILSSLLFNFSYCFSYCSSAWRTASTKCDSGSAPVNSTRSLITVLGTP